LKAKAVVRLELKKEKQLTALISALGPEVSRQVGNRSKATLAIEELSLIINFEAGDTIALRASMNAYLRWISSMISVLEVAEENDTSLSTS
jgi:tRNA threonylcarbamoyladenosine modification (KEOPS) complex  Pcc1 subunit